MSHLEALYQYFYGIRYDVKTSLELGKHKFYNDLTLELLKYNKVYSTKLWKLFNEGL